MLRNKWLSKSILSVAIATAFAVSASADLVELTTNGGFETGNFDGWQQFPTGMDQQTITNVNPSSGTWSANIFNDVDASNSLIKQANIGVGIVSAGQEVKISFDARGGTFDGGVVFAEFFSEIDGGGVSSSEILGGAPLALNADSNVWTTYNFTTFAGPDVSGGVTLQLGAVTAAIPTSEVNVFFDNVSVSVHQVAVPEPTSAALLGLGCIGMVFRRKRS